MRSTMQPAVVYSSPAQISRAFELDGGDLMLPLMIAKPDGRGYWEVEEDSEQNIILKWKQLKEKT